MTEKDDINLYVLALENEMCQAQLPVKRYKAALTSRLTPTTKELIVDLQADPTRNQRQTPGMHRSNSNPGRTANLRLERDISSYSIAQLIPQV